MINGYELLRSWEVSTQQHVHYEIRESNNLLDPGNPELSLSPDGNTVTATRVVVVDKGVYLRVYLAQLRRKLEPDPARPRHLITEPGMGYRFER